MFRKVVQKLNKTQGERIKQIRKEYHLTLEKFGERIGLKKSSLSQIENGINALTDTAAKLICREYNVNPYWLETGNGEMFINPSFDDMDFSEELLKPENKMYLELFKACKKTFTSEDWEDISRIIKKSYQIVQELENTTEEIPERNE